VFRKAGTLVMDMQHLLEQTIALHNHLCPRQVLGVRIGMYAADLLNLELPQVNKRLYTFVETDGCFADGVAVATGCWLGHRTMRLLDYGKVAATFVDTKTGQALRIWPSAQSRELAGHYAEGGGSWQVQLEGYQRMPAAELLEVCEVDLSLCVDAIISRPGVRVNCAICGEEILNEREVELNGQLVCLSCAGNTYWRKAAVSRLTMPDDRQAAR
jgi:formylmethanofuran dehydrogenase subunit E